MKIEKLYTYPVKALRAVELDSVQVTKYGFPHDRRFMLLQVLKQDDGSVKYENIHIANTPQSARFFPSLDLKGERIKITYRPANGGEETSIDLPLYPNADDLDVVEVNMHRSPTKAYKMPKEYNDWFSTCYGFDVILATLGRNYRAVLMSTSHNKQASSTANSASSWLSSITNTATSYLTGSNKENGTSEDKNILTFNDVAPYLVASSRSMDDLHHRINSSSPETRMDILKFRPNIIVSGAEEPWEEDYWGQLTIHSSTSASESAGVVIDCIHNCGRCKSINIDYSTGAPSKGPEGNMLKQMQRDRRVDPGMKWSPIFGRYSFLGEGCEGKTVRVGNEVVVSGRLEGGTRFDWEGLATT